MTVDRLIQLVAGVLAPGSLAAWLYRRWSARIHVRRIRDPDDADLPDALDLYDRRIEDPATRDSSEEIIRWLEEVRHEQAIGEVGLLDYLLVAKRRGKVCGFFYGQYFDEGFLFVSYLVGGEKGATDAIARWVKHELRKSLQGCRGVVFELEAARAGQKERWLSRFRRFERIAATMGFEVRRLDFAYRQPRVSLWDDDAIEPQQVLFYGKPGRHGMGNAVPKEEVVRVLRCLFDDWYGQCYEGVPERDAEYRAYLRRLRESTISLLPDYVPALPR